MKGLMDQLHTLGKPYDNDRTPAVEIYDLVDALHSCKQALGKPVSEHVLEMKGLMDQLHTLGKPYDNDMALLQIELLFLLDWHYVIPAGHVPAGHVLISADRYRIC
ncbi:hypothetical protein Tco_0797723 [Tanacetum coccineum]